MTTELLKPLHFVPTDALANPLVELFGHVTLVEAYNAPNYHGFHALVALRDYPGEVVALLSTSTREQDVLEAGLITGNLIAFTGALLNNPPTPLGGTWAVPVYGHVVSVILYNFK